MYKIKPNVHLLEPFNFVPIETVCTALHSNCFFYTYYLNEKNGYTPNEASTPTSGTTLDRYRLFISLLYCVVSQTPIMDFQAMLQQAKDRASAIAKGTAPPPADAGNGTTEVAAPVAPLAPIPSVATGANSGYADVSGGGGGMKRSAEDDANDSTKRINTGLGYVAPTMPGTDTYDIPTGSAGLVIGRGGETIKRLQAQSGARLQIAPDSHDGVHRRVTITGDTAAIENVRQLIKEVVDTSLSTQTNVIGSNSVEGPEEKIEVMCPNNRVGVIIGRGGEKIRELQATSGARIQVLQDNQPPGAVNKPVLISGDSDKVAVAKKLVLEIIEDQPYGQAGGASSSFGGPSGGNASYGGAGKFSESPYGTVKVELNIPSDSVGLVIGHGGTTIKRLQAESGSKIQLDPDQGRPERTVSIEGFADSVKRGEQAVMDIVRQHQERQSGSSVGTISRSNSTAGSGGNFGYSARGTEVKVGVDSTKVGLVIGRGGETIKQIQAQTGARVQLDRDGPQNGPEKFFTVGGSDEEIAAARAMIAEKTGGGPPMGGGMRGPGGSVGWGQGGGGGRGGYGSGQDGPGGWGQSQNGPHGGYGTGSGSHSQPQHGGYGVPGGYSGAAGGYGQSSQGQGPQGASRDSYPGGSGGYGPGGYGSGGFGAGSGGGYNNQYGQTSVGAQGSQQVVQGGYSGGYQSQQSQEPVPPGQDDGPPGMSRTVSQQPAAHQQQQQQPQGQGQGASSASGSQADDQWTEQQKVWAEQWKQYYAQQAAMGQGGEQATGAECSAPGQ
eukprot:CFRG5179T1